MSNRDIHSDRILILDFGSQYTQLIARKIREIGVYCEVHPYYFSDQSVREFQPSGIILSGGPESVMAEQPPKAPDQVFKQGCPVLGICYGLQTMAQQLGGAVAVDQDREFGQAQIVLHQHSYLFEKIEDAISANGEALLDVWMSHGDRVETLPPGFKVIAATPAAPVAAMADESRHFYGLQFHPEVTHTRQGVRILERFVRNICGCHALWTANNIAADMIVNIRDKVGKENVILGLSGGVDSSVVAALLHQAISTQLTCVFVDTGLLRLGDVERVMVNIGKHMGVKIVHVDAANRFFNALAGVDDPEQKRKIIGALFIEVFEEEAAKIKDAKWLAQGTIYSDVIESAGSKSAHLIKSHHNVGGLPEKMTLKLLEPLRELFKDEVRKLGIELGLPHDMVYCHPFPGPGLSVRILGEVSAKQADLLRIADAIFIDELRANDLYDKVSQAFAVLLPVKSVAVMGDARYHEPVIALRAVVTTDFMTAHWAQLPYEFLGKVSTRIINETKGISRVVYDISNKPPATIEWE